MLFKIIGSPFPCCTRLIFPGEDDFLYRPTCGTWRLYRLIQVNSSKISTVKQQHDYGILTPGCIAYIASFVSIKKTTMSFISYGKSGCRAPVGNWKTIMLPSLTIIYILNFTHRRHGLGEQNIQKTHRSFSSVSSCKLFLVLSVHVFVKQCNFI